MVEARAMGGALVGLSHSARAVLFVMAMNAHDTGNADTPPRTYFRGWEHLARVALGRATYDDNAEHAVKRALRELVDAGYVKQTGRRHGERHGRVLYEIHI
jgi:hypothetical protein